MLLAGFETAIPASEPQTHALDRAATGTGRATEEDLEIGHTTTFFLALIQRPLCPSHVGRYCRPLQL